MRCIKNTERITEMKNITRCLCAALSAVFVMTAASCSGNWENVTAGDDYKAGERTYANYNLDEYIKLGSYTGLTITIPKPYVTDEEVQRSVQSVLFSHATSENRTTGNVADGDIINIDYVGKMDGKAFEGGSAKDQNLALGSGTMIPGFEEALVGAEVGKTVTIDVTFPDPYSSNPDFSGKPAQFDVTVNYVIELVQPELTDSFVRSISSAKTIEEYVELKRSELLAEKEASSTGDKMDAVWLTVKGSSEVIKYPETELLDYKNEFIYYYEDEAKTEGRSLAEHMETKYGIKDLDQFETDALDYAYDYVENDLVFRAIVAKENITISDEEYAAGLMQFYASYGSRYFDSVEGFEAEAGKSYIESNLLWNKLLEFLIENNTFVYAE